MNRVNEFNKKIAIRHIILGLLISAYLFLEISQINLPGLFCDEAIVGNNSLMILNNEAAGHPYAVKVFNRTFPLTINFHPALPAYLAYPFIYFLGVKTSSLRLFTILGGTLTLFFIYFFVKGFFNYKVALISIFLLAVNPTFFIRTKMGLMCGSVTHTVIFSSLLCFLKWYLYKKSIYFSIGMFLLGIVISLGYVNLWFIVALLICSLIFYSDLKKRLKENNNYYMELLLGSLFFALGSFLILYYNFISKFATLKTIWKYLHYSSAGINNLNYIANLSTRIHQLFSLLEGEEFRGNYQYISIFFLLSLTWLVYLLIFKKVSLFSKKRIFFIVTLFLLILLQTPFTLTTFIPSHLFIFYPLLHIILALALIEAFFHLKKIRIIKVLIYIIFCVLAFAEITKFFRGYIYFQRTHGQGFVSDVINDLSKWLSKKNDYNIIVLDWGVYDNLYFLTQGKVNIIDMSHYCEQADDKARVEFSKWLKERYKEENNLYVSLSPQFRGVYSCSDIFAEAVQKFNLAVVEEKKFYQRDNQLLYSVFSVHDE